MKKIISVLLVCVMLISLFCSVSVFAEYDKVRFTDITPTPTNGYLNIKSLVEKGIMEGYTETTFAPGRAITREQVAKVIVLAAKAPLTSNTGSFSDVKSGAWYEVYVESALAANLMTGVSSNTFGVGKYITRQDAAVLVHRMAAYMNIDIEKVKNVDIPDADSISEYAMQPVQALLNMNVAELKSDGNFNPTANITRLEFAKLVDRMLISDESYYDDYLSDWTPQERDIESYSSEQVAFEDFENGLTTMSGYEASMASYGNATNYIVKNMGKDSTSSLSCTAGVNYNSIVNVYLYDIEPGVDYYVSYDLKTVGIPDTAFVRVNYQWHNASGSLAGTYERNNDFYGSSDWFSQHASCTAPLPDASPKFLRIALSIRDSDVGTVYMDNLKIHKVIYEPLNSYLKFPSYKGLITEPNGEGDIQLTTYVKGIGTIYNKEDFRIEAEISDFNGKSFEKSVQNTISQEMDITFSSNILKIGDYDLSVKMINKSTDKVEATNHWVLRKRDPSFTSTYNFDKYGRLLKNGEPHFPIGSYSLGVNESDIADFKDTPIEFMIVNSNSSFWSGNSLYEKMREYGISAMFRTDPIYKDAMRGEYQYPDITTKTSERVVLERIVDDLNFATEEAHIGYQINNEFPAESWAERIAWQHNILSEIDFDHLTYGVGAGGKQAAIDYARCHDVYASDPYPITGADTDEIWQVYDNARGLVDGTVGRPVWTVVQVSDLKVMNRDPYTSRERGPNETELRNMVWQAVCAGAQGIIYYAHFHLDDERPENEEDVEEGKYYVSRPKSETFPEIIRVSEELDEYKDVILSVEDTPNVKLTSTDSSKFAHLVRRYDGKTYVFMVNMSKEAQDVSVYLESASSAHGVYSDRDYKIENSGKTSLTIDGLGVEILVVDQPERPSADCELKNAHFYDDDNNYFIVKDGDTNTIYLPEGVDTLRYKVDIHPDARVIVNGCPNKTKGTMSVDDKDKIRFTVISEDGQNYTQHWYNIVRI